MNTREIQVLKTSAQQMNFPFSEQLILLRRHRHYLKDDTQEEGFLYLLCNRIATQCSALELIDFSRGHWIIESCLHYCRDTNFNEDRCRIVQRTRARVCSTLRSLANYILGKNRTSRKNTRARKHKRFCCNLGLAVNKIMQAT